MKKNFVKIGAILLGFALAACLDDNKYALDPSGTNNVIEFADESIPQHPNGAVYPMWTTSTKLAPEFTFTQTINYAGPRSNDQAIEITVEVDPTALDEYNQQMNTQLHGATFEMMPDDYYTFPKTTLTIPKGKKSVDFDIKVFPNNFDLEQSFALPLRITSASEGILSEHFSAGIFNVVVKNLYDGIFLVKSATVNRYNTATPPVLENPTSLGGDYPSNTMEIPMATINKTANSFGIKWKDGSGVAGVTGIRTIVDEAGAAPPGAPAGSLPVTVTNDESPMTNSGPSYYVPATRTFVLNFEWVGGSGKREVRNWEMVFSKDR